MQKMIQLSSIDDVKEFVNNVKELDQPVFVSKEGFAFQLDGASIMGLMALIGSKIIVSYEKATEKFLQLLDRKQVV
ncbi:MAG: hypothetical protein SPI28_10415 [Acetatifactor sp.]|nr:hypothetical protein [Acetatifactor sp.]